MHTHAMAAAAAAAAASDRMDVEEVDAAGADMDVEENSDYGRAVRLEAAQPEQAIALYRQLVEASGDDGAASAAWPDTSAARVCAGTRR